MQRRTILRAALGSSAAGVLLSGAELAAAAASLPQPGADGVFNLCFLGDSYMAGTDSTDGNGARKAVLDWLIINNERRDVRCVGSMASTGNAGGYGYTIPLVHEGHPGWTTSQLLALVQGGGLAYAQGRPHVLFLMAGANDFNAGLTPAAVCANLTTLLDAVLDACPDAGVVLCEHVLMSSYKSSVLTNRSRQGQELNAMLPGVVAARVDRVLLAETSVLDQQDINNNGVHPTDLGYQKMAYALYGSLAPWLGRNGVLAPVKHPWWPAPDPFKL